MGKRLCARNGALRAPIDDSGHARPSPLGCGRSPPYLRLVTGVRLAPPVSSLAEDTFAPAQPPFIVTELLGEKTNLTQKKPYTLSSVYLCNDDDVLLQYCVHVLT